MYGREWRHIVEQCIGPMWQLTAAHWEDSEELVNQMIEEVGLGNAPIESRSGIEVAIVPRFLATRDRAQEVEPDLPSSIVVLGVHHSGAPDVGSFLATRTGYAFALLSNLAVEQFGKVSDTRRRTFHEHELAVAFLEDPLGAGRLLVWAFNDHDALLQSLPTISSSQTDVLTVFLRADDDIVAYHAGRQALTELGFSRGGGARRELRARFDDLRRGLQAVQDSLERTVVGRDADRVVVLDVASPSVPAQPGMSYGQGDPWDSENPCFADDVDAFFACYADIAADLSLKLDLT
jgi:hypothetical protein